MNQENETSAMTSNNTEETGDALYELIDALDLHNNVPTFETTRIRWIVANHPNTPVSVLRSMVEHMPLPIVRRVAEHPSLPEEMLDVLSRHADGEVRLSVAENHRTPRYLLERLLHDDSCDVRYSLASNYNLGQDMLARMLDDDNPYVVQRARNTLRRMEVSVCIAFPLSYEERVIPYPRAALG